MCLFACCNQKMPCWGYSQRRQFIRLLKSRAWVFSRNTPLVQEPYYCLSVDCEIAVSNIRYSQEQAPAIVKSCLAIAYKLLLYSSGSSLPFVHIFVGLVVKHLLELPKLWIAAATITVILPCLVISICYFYLLKVTRVIGVRVIFCQGGGEPLAQKFSQDAQILH